MEKEMAIIKETSQPRAGNKCEKESQNNSALIKLGIYLKFIWGTALADFQNSITLPC